MFEVLTSSHRRRFQCQGERIRYIHTHRLRYVHDLYRLVVTLGPVHAQTYLYDSVPKATDHMSPFIYSTNFLPMDSSRMQGNLVYNRFEGFRNDDRSHEDADESGLEEFWTRAPDALAAHSYEMLNQPSVEFTRQTWWQSLTRYYGGPRAHATRRITEDLSHLFRVSNYFLSFINVPLFFSTLHHPGQREHVQPSLVLAMLALSTLIQSGDLGLGQKAILRALELRDLAQSHFDMSLSSGWVSPGLAQAAMLLVLFEASCHPAYSESRAHSTLFLLDSLILGLGLLELDKEEYNVTALNPNSVASLFGPLSDHIDQAAIGQGTTNQGCSCLDLQLSNTSPSSKKITPFWGTCPGWSEEWDVVEIRREEQRRLVWNAHALASGHLSFYDSVDRTSLNLSIAKAWNFKVFFPGEKLFGTPQMQDDLTAKHSIWALQSRCYMLYTSCFSVHHDASISEYDKGQFAVQAWLESEQIEKMLNTHTCNIERAFLYFGRQVLFHSRNLVTSQYSRYVPHPNIGDPHFNRDKAVLWLSHQQRVVQNFLPALPRVAGPKDNMLASRPYFTFWFHDQLARYLNIWRQDPTLHIALHLCVTLLRPVEYLMTLFPSNYPRQRYEVLHQRLVDACIFAGIPPPPPPSYLNQ
ncbi:hypothetical protein BS47DRAFT_1312356 [Hydnum rufescens UP504]|uniref:Transcription factor domain-containing protein n=1 Tax=Hydnum rufescens UP504 TaxID=1448309 RepID=A0A9P6B8I8_9AGAM|nr:hypothetical protein BS47DRAFT_1312356 [Hydnum rufescens UP504]